MKAHQAVEVVSRPPNPWRFLGLNSGGMDWGTMMSPALWQLESDPPPRKGVSRLGSELYRDDKLEAHLIKVQTKKLSS